MPDSATDTITNALMFHRARQHKTTYYCNCGITNTVLGDSREAHLADVCVAALTQAGHLPLHPVTTRTDHTAEATWRAAALNICATWAHNPIPGVDVRGIQQDDLTARWPSLADAIRRLVRAKEALLKEHP